MKVSISQLAANVGKSERTIERWIAAGKMQATRAPDGLYEVPDSTMTPHDDIAAQLHDLSERLDRLEQSQARIAEGISDIQQGISEIKTLLTSTSFKQIAPRIPYSTSEAASRPAAHNTLPPGALTAKEFAELYNLNYYTFRDHIIKGLAGEILHVSERPKPGRPHETERYLTPEDQEAALDFWQRHGVAFSLPDQPAQKE